MGWIEMTTEERKVIVISLSSKGLSSREIGGQLACTAKIIQSFMRRRGIKGLHRGGLLGNQNARVNGQGKNTIRRLTRRVLLSCNKNLHKCERCSFEDHTEELPRHHKDRDRTNNDPSNLEILCKTCHGIEHMQERDRDLLGRVI